MRVLIVNSLDARGGAHIAAYRLHKGLLEHGVDSLMLVQRKSLYDQSVIGPESDLLKLKALIAPRLEQILLRRYKNKSSTLFSPAIIPSPEVVKQINTLKPDIVHLHWICNGFIRIEDIPKIKAPIVWTLHDMWGFTGGCHVDEGCGRYRQQCGRCHVLRSNKEKDISRSIWHRKKKAYSSIKNLTIVALSRRRFDEIASSSLLGDKNIVHLSNPIDTNLYKPLEKKWARRLWNLPEDKKLVLFGVMDAKNSYKGYDLLIKALKKLKGRKDIELVLYGGVPVEGIEGFRIHYLGKISDQTSMVTLCNAADVMVLPSRQETLPNSVLESLACGTPVVAFDIGGNPDMIEHKRNGYLAKPFDTEDLKEGILWVLENPDYESLRENARQKVLRKFDMKVMIPRYIELYERIIKKGGC